ncbi:MAG: amino acid adenylation domain-containing protein [Gammaproteobacteria bacterium]|nr:amino acid adenylation domain-containing protein [Gammaproteobacteria bacterium]
MSDLASEMQQLSAQEKRKLLAQLLQQRARVKPTHYPLSLVQEPLWFIDRMLQGRPVYHQHGGFRIVGQLDISAFERAFDEIVQRHEVMRTVLPAVDGQPVQQVLSDMRFQLPLEDLSALTPDERESQIKTLCAREAHVPIDLETGPLWRARLFRLADDEYLIYLKIHHIISDGWSINVVMQELLALYQNFSQDLPSPLAPLTLQYRDYAVWQRQRLQGARLEELLSYWRRKLAPPIAAIELPLKGPRPAMQTHRGAHRRIHLPLELIDRARTLARTERSTLFMLLLAVFKLLLSRYSSQNDIVVGAPVANRSRPEFEPLVGYFASMTVLRTDLNGEPTFRQLLQRVRETVTDAFKYQELPLETLVKELRPERDPSRHPLFQVMFVLQAGRGNLSREVPGVKFTPLKSGTGSSKFDLQLVGVRHADYFKLALGYNCDLLEKEVAERMLDHYQTALEAVIADPDLPISRVPLMGADEIQRISALGSGASLPLVENACVHRRFEQQAAATPDTLAVECAGVRLTYAELNARANGLARRLRALGVAADDRVAVLLERSPAFIVSILAVLKAGAAYVPLDTQTPSARLHEIVSQCGARVLISSVVSNRLLPVLPAAVERMVIERLDDLPADDVNLVAITHAHNLAYVIYTSGSTGKPKGVMIEHRALMNYIQAVTDAYQLCPSDRVLQFASLSFDAHIEEIFPTLCVGAAVVLRTDAMLDSFSGFSEACTAAGITVLSLPTAYWHEWVATLTAHEQRAPLPLRLLVIGGERALPERVASWIQQVGHGVCLLNTYGPTESTVIATCHEARDPTCDDRLMPVPIGRPIANVRARVLDAFMQLVPVGIIGELYLGGEGLARGYLGDPALTEQRFVQDPFQRDSQVRLYRTGDLARWRPDGELEFMGRVDMQVKLRGFRVEPEEIEAVLNEHPGVIQAAVVTCVGAVGSPRLVACVVGGTDAPSPSELREFLSEQLPKFMVPSAFVTVSELPLTVTGKIDRKLLANEVGRRAVELQTAYESPVTETERRVADIFGETLNVPRVGRRDNFFDLGGHSLLAVRLMTRIRAEFSVELPLVALFAKPTVAELAIAIDGRQSSLEPVDTGTSSEMVRIVEKLFVPDSDSPLVELAAAGNSERPMFLVHGLGGHVAIYADLARRLGERLPIYGLQAAGIDGKRAAHGDLTEMASYYLAAIRERQPRGPYRLGGWSMGGMLVLEMAQQLRTQGQSVELLAMFDTHLPKSQEPSAVLDDDAAIKWIAARFGVPAQMLLALPKRMRWRAVLQRARKTLILPPEIGEEQLENLARICQLHVQALTRYQPLPYDGEVLLFRAHNPTAKASRRARRHFDTAERWQSLFTKLTEHPVRGNHYAIMREPNIENIEHALLERLTDR